MPTRVKVQPKFKHVFDFCKYDLVLENQKANSNLVSTILLKSSDDWRELQEMAEGLYKHLPSDCRVVVFEDGSHVPVYEAPGALEPTRPLNHQFVPLEEHDDH